MMADFRDHGFIAISGVPGFVEAYDRFIAAAREFTALPAEIQAECTPADSFGRGQSRGIEALAEGRKDTYKGSYYAWSPDNEAHPNVWPRSLPRFQTAYLEVAGIIAGVGKEILPLLDRPEETICLARMLHYGAVPEGEDDGNPNWCGLHRDHGLITGLCPEVYFRDGERVEKPAGSGLYILGREISPPPGVMMFQIGEVLELVTNGATRATEHWVQKALGGYERYTMAVFFDPPEDMRITCTNEGVIAKYADRYTPGVLYKTWGERSYAKYNPDSKVAVTGEGEAAEVSA